MDNSWQEHTRAYIAIDSESEAKSDGHDDLQAGRANKLRVEQLELKLKEAQKQVTRHVEALWTCAAAGNLLSNSVAVLFWSAQSANPG